MMVRRRHIRSLVERLLKEHNITRIPVDPIPIVASLGIQLKASPGPEEISGFFMRDPQTGRPIIGVNTAHHLKRQRFTIAHELGHFYLHDYKEVHIDRIARNPVKLRGPKSGLGTDEEEVEANDFAAQLLMPEQFFARDILEARTPSLFEEDALAPMLGMLAEKYQVSRAALGFRILHLRTR